MIIPADNFVFERRRLVCLYLSNVGYSDGSSRASILQHLRRGMRYQNESLIKIDNFTTLSIIYIIL